MNLEPTLSKINKSVDMNKNGRFQLVDNEKNGEADKRFFHTLICLFRFNYFSNI